MSTLTVTNIETANSTTDLTISTGNTSASPLVLSSSGTLTLGNSTINCAINSSSLSIDGTISATSLSGSYTASGDLLPDANNTHDLGSATMVWANIYTGDLNLNNGIGDYTIVEGEDDLFLYNNKKNKVYKFALVEVYPSEAPPKKGDD